MARAASRDCGCRYRAGFQVVAAGQRFPGGRSGGVTYLTTGILAGMLAACVTNPRPQPWTKKKPQS